MTRTVVVNVVVSEKRSGWGCMAWSIFLWLPALWVCGILSGLLRDILHIVYSVLGV